MSLNGEIPTIPITTLAGVTSLTELLPELPLPSPLPGNIAGNKSLFYDQRMLDEAKHLLTLQDPHLISQLHQALCQANTSHIELKDKSISDNTLEGEVPPLLQALITVNPDIFLQRNMEMGGLQSMAQPHLYQPSQQQHLPDSQMKYVHNHASGQNMTSPVHLNQNSHPILPQNTARFSENSGKYHQFTDNYQAQVIQQAAQGSVNGFSGHQYPVSNTPSDTQSHYPKLLQQQNSKDVAQFSQHQYQMSGGNSVSNLPINDNQFHNLSHQMQSTLDHNLHGLSKDESNLLEEICSEDLGQEMMTDERATSLKNKAASLKLKVKLGKESGTGTSKNDNDSSIKETKLKQKRKKKQPREESNQDTIGHYGVTVTSPQTDPYKIPVLKLTRISPKVAEQAAQGKYKLDVKDAPVPLPPPKEENFTGRQDNYDETEIRRLALGLRRKPLPSTSSKKGKKYADVEESNDSENSPGVAVYKKKKFDKSTIGAQDTEELMESVTFKRFTDAIESVIEHSEEMDVPIDLDAEDFSPDLLLPKPLLSELTNESAKLKTLGVTNKVSLDKLIQLLNILEKNIRDGSRLVPTLNQGDGGGEEEKLWRELTMERLTRSVDASLAVLYIMVSPNMPKEVFIEDVIEKIVMLTMFQLQNTIFPKFDPVYRSHQEGQSNYLINMKMKRARASATKERVILELYNKLCEIISNLADLIDVQLLTDSIILMISSIGTAPFFVENVSELQLSSLKLITNVFAHYEKHRQLILEDILASLARLPSSKKNLRTYRLNGDESIQMVTALTLQLIQSVVLLPLNDDNDQCLDQEDVADEQNKSVDRDVLIVTSYDMALRTAQNFLSVFLKKCTSKVDEEDYRPLFENFVQDLLSTVNKPEWPAAEVLLSLLGRLLVHHFSNRSNDMSLRVSSLDYLGQVASRLRKDAVSSHLSQDNIDDIVREMEDTSLSSAQHPKSPSSSISEPPDQIQILQHALLDYLANNGQNDPALLFARHFYIGQWYRDVSLEIEKTINAPPPERKEGEMELPSNAVNLTTETIQLAERRKLFLQSMIKVDMGPFISLRQSHKFSHENMCLIARYLTSSRPFAQSFDIYLSQILRVLSETAVAVRTKAMKCLSAVVAADPGILAREDMQRGVHGRFMDQSTSVREAAVELVGKFVLLRPELIPQYYDMIMERILDAGISVRKRVIKILRDICIEHSEFPKTSEICVKIIRRVNDEEGIKKLVNDTFQKMWFSPVNPSHADILIRRVHTITDVVAACKDGGYDWFEQLLNNLLKSEEENTVNSVNKACRQIVQCLVEDIIRQEEKYSIISAEGRGSYTHKLVSCIQTLYLLSKVKPQLLVEHVRTLQPYLSTKCGTQGDNLAVYNVAKILELVVPLMEHPGEVFLASLEEDLMKLIIKQGQMVLQACVSCLSSVVNKVTHNYKLIRDCFQKYFGFLSKLRTEHSTNPYSDNLTSNKPTLLRSLFTVGLFCNHFDFDADLKGGKKNLKVSVKNRVFEVLIYFLDYQDEEIVLKALSGLGFFCNRHAEFMMGNSLKEKYQKYLTDKSCSVKFKIQVLKNFQLYLSDEEEKLRKADAEWAKKKQKEDIKEMQDIHSGMSSSVIQLFLKPILESYMHPQTSVRIAVLAAISLVLRQGLVHPVQCIPYLISMGTDVETNVRVKADQLINEIDQKYPGFLHMKAISGIKMSFHLQQLVHTEQSEPLRGVRAGAEALCSHLYTKIRGNRQHRRALLQSLLSLYDEQQINPLELLVYVADNLAYFPYLIQDEPLFVIHHIEILVSVSGAYLLQSFKENLCGKSSRPPSRASKEGDPTSNLFYNEVEENVDSLLMRIPDDPLPLIKDCVSSQGCLILLVLKQHLKDLYGFRDSTTNRYSPNESAKIYDKPLNRKQGVVFDPARAISLLKTGSPELPLSLQAKKHIIQQYLDFKHLMEMLDPAEDENEDAKNEAKLKASNALATSLNAALPLNENVAAFSSEACPNVVEEVDAASSADSSGDNPPPPPIIPTFVPQLAVKQKQKHGKPKQPKKQKKHKKKRKRIEDSESDVSSDPDFMT